MIDVIPSPFKAYELLSTTGAVAIIKDDFKIHDCNDAFAEFLELPVADIINKGLTEFVNPRERDNASVLIEHALSGQPENDYVSFYTKAKKKIGNISFVPLFEGSVVTGLYCFIKDVSSKVIKNRNVFDSEQRLKAIFENEPECVKIVSINGLLLDINPAGVEMLEAKKEEILGQKVLMAVHPDDRDAFQRLHEQTCKGKKGSLQFRMEGFKGTKRWMHSNTVPLKNKNGEIYAVLSVTRDITEQKEAEIKIQLSEQRFKNLVSNGTDIIVIVNEKGDFQYLSDNVTAILGHLPQDLVNKNAFDFIHPEDAPAVLVQLHKVIAEDKTALGTAHRFLNSSGEWIWLESKGINHLADPSINGIVVNARDIMERIKLEEKLSLEKANKQKQITAAVIETQEKERTQLGLELHDNVNQVLTTIKLYNELLLSGMGDPKDLLNRSVKHLQECISEIRSISKRLSAPTLGKINLDESVRELIQSINLTNRITIQYSCTGFSGCNITQDLHLAIYRIIQEQLSNILKHSDATEVYIDLHLANRQILLSIADNGKGFNKAVKSSGIGITNMISRAEHMGGILEIDSAPGKGCSLFATFSL